LIRSRLTLVFIGLALLALLQLLFAWWATHSAAHHAEASVVATKRLAEYLEISGDKQRLKVWFAQKMLAGDALPAERERLVGAMNESVRQLQALAAHGAGVDAALERATVATVAQNIQALDRAVREAAANPSEFLPDEQWRQVLLAFDELAGRDMRELLRESVQRHETASLRESELLAAALQRIRVVNALLAASVLLGALAAVIYFVRRLQAPFARLAELTSALAQGDYRARSGMRGGDEFARIGRLLDTMAERLDAAQARSAELQAKLDQLVAERTRALTHAYEALLGIEARRRQFFAELSHELRTPVTIIRGEAELALRAPDGGAETRQGLARIVETAGELGARVQDLLQAARGSALDYAFALRPGSLVEIVGAAVGQMQAVAAHRGLGLELAPTADDPARFAVQADHERLQQALVVVLDNALRYSEAAGRVRVSLAIEDEFAWVYVDDEGPGMSEEDLAHSFEPHYRGSAGRARDASGMGVGLAISRRIVEAHRGSVELTPRQPRGLRVGIGLPCLQPDGGQA
jgi:two-component system OmpR family sensor kinase